MTKRNNSLLNHLAVYIVSTVAWYQDQYWRLQSALGLEWRERGWFSTHFVVLFLVTPQKKEERLALWKTLFIIESFTQTRVYNWLKITNMAQKKNLFRQIKRHI